MASPLKDVPWLQIDALVPRPEPACHGFFAVVGDADAAGGLAWSDVTAVAASAAPDVTVPITLSVTRGDEILLVQPAGHAQTNLGDGAIYLSE